MRRNSMYRRSKPHNSMLHSCFSAVEDTIFCSTTVESEAGMSTRFNKLQFAIGFISSGSNDDDLPKLAIVVGQHIWRMKILLVKIS